MLSSFREHTFRCSIELQISSINSPAGTTCHCARVVINTSGELAKPCNDRLWQIYRNYTTQNRLLCLLILTQFIWRFTWGVIIHPCHNFNSCSVNNDWRYGMDKLLHFYTFCERGYLSMSYSQYGIISALLRAWAIKGISKHWMYVFIPYIMTL